MSLLHGVCLTAVSPGFAELCLSFIIEIAFIAGKVSPRKWEDNSRAS